MIIALKMIQLYNLYKFSFKWLTLNLSVIAFVAKRGLLR